MGDRVLVCGDRNWKDLACILNVLKTVKPDVVIEGGARGADSLARLAAESLNIPVEEYLANWEEYGRAAGPLRNQEMLDKGKPDKVVAFHNDIEKSKGTKNMINLAKRKGVSWIIIHSND